MPPTRAPIPILASQVDGVASGSAAQANQADLQLPQGAVDGIHIGTALVQGNRLYVGAAGQKRGGFELPCHAETVIVEVLTHGGSVVDEITLLDQESGRHFFEWIASPWMDDPVSFRVSASNGAADLPVVHLTRVRVGTAAAAGVGADQGPVRVPRRPGEAGPGCAITFH